MPIFSHSALRKLTLEIFEAAGACSEEAEIVSDLLVKANLSGHDSHGVMRIPQYVNEIQNKGIRLGVKPRIIRETPSSALLDGKWGFGQVIAKRGMEIAVEKAMHHSSSIVSIFNCNHIGRLADYTIMAAEKDMIGMAAVNDRNLVAPYGGTERILNTCPLSYAFPSNLKAPLVLDITTSVCAEGKIRAKLHEGKRLPNGLIIDRDGNPSNNPEDFYDGGSILPLGGEFGYKGYGLGLVAEILSGVLSKDGFSFEKKKWGNGVFLQAINIESFTTTKRFKNSINRLIAKIRSSKIRPGFDEILVPGELEFRTEQERRKKGIVIPDMTWKLIVDAANSLGLSL